MCRALASALVSVDVDPFTKKDPTIEASNTPLFDQLTQLPVQAIGIIRPTFKLVLCFFAGSIQFLNRLILQNGHHLGDFTTTLQLDFQLRRKFLGPLLQLQHSITFPSDTTKFFLVNRPRQAHQRTFLSLGIFQPVDQSPTLLLQLPIPAAMLPLRGLFFSSLLKCRIQLLQLILKIDASRG